MVDGVAGVAELGVLTVSAEEWAAAVRRAKVIGRLAREQRVGVAAAADVAAAELGISRQQVYGVAEAVAGGFGGGL
jgi:putative transposase